MNAESIPVFVSHFKMQYIDAHSTDVALALTHKVNNILLLHIGIHLFSKNFTPKDNFSGSSIILHTSFKV